MIKRLIRWFAKIFGISLESPCEIVDNLDTFVKDKHNTMFKDTKSFDIATGYFQISGWKAFADWAGLQIYENLVVGVEERDEIPQPDNINLGLYNIVGQKVRDFPLSPLSSGNHTVNLPFYGLSNGIYFLRLEGRTINQTVKVVKVVSSE